MKRILFILVAFAFVWTIGFLKPFETGGLIVLAGIGAYVIVKMRHWAMR